MAAPTSELSRARERLDPGAFAFVMATGVVSVAASLDSLPLVSDALLAIACLGWCDRAGPGLARSRRTRPRLTMLGWPWAALALGALAAAAWLVLLGRSRSRGRPDGSWFLLVVGTQSLAVLAAGLAPRWNGDLL
jgi:hypothetical protein